MQGGFKICECGWGGSEQKISTGAGFYVVRTKEHFTEI